METPTKTSGRIPSFPLAGGGSIPSLGLGTWQLTGKACTDAVKQAFALGYTHLDTAEMYANHEEIGRALRGHDRSKLFRTSKVWTSNLRRADVIAACEEALTELATPYIDLYLIHWPNRAIPVAETFDALRELKEQGLIRHVGVANFTVKHLEEARNVSKVPIAMDQVEFHPYLYQKGLLDYCRKHGILLTAYSPLAQGKVFRDEKIAAIARKHGKTAGQVTLRWLHEKGIVAIPKASSEKHLRENRAIFDFALDDEDTEILDNLPQRRLIDPPFAEFG